MTHAEYLKEPAVTVEWLTAIHAATVEVRNEKEPADG